MNSILIEPGIPLANDKLIPLLNKITREIRLDTTSHPVIKGSNLTIEIEKIMSKQPNTIIAFGSYRWLDRIISESCKFCQSHNQPIPIFAHISPPKRIKAIWNIPPYIEYSLKRSVRMISARKLIEKKAFVCADTIWFTHSLELISPISSGAPARFTVQTPNKDILRIDAPTDTLRINIQESIIDQQKHLITIQAKKKSASTTNSKIKDKSTSLIEKKIKTNTLQKAPEEVFHIQATKVEIQAPDNFSSTVSSQPLPKNFNIEPSKYSIKMITKKNDIAKY